MASNLCAKGSVGFLESICGKKVQQQHSRFYKVGDGARIPGGAKMPRNLRQSARLMITEAAVAPPLRESFVDEGDYIKAGGEELELVQMQALKAMDQANIADKLPALGSDNRILDLAVIGCGPAGLSLAAEAAKKGLSVALIGPDLPFTNNYGVWQDEFEALGLENCIEHTWKDTAMYFSDDNSLLLGRAYGRVGRDQLRQELLRRCSEANVLYHCSEVERIDSVDKHGSTLVCTDGKLIKCRLATFASGAASGKFLKYEALEDRGMSIQTAYGIEVEVEAHPYDPKVMVFMDYRDYKSGDTNGEVPSFLYVMPFSKSKVFFEETCLAARPVMSFATLKERLYARLEKLGVKVLHVYEEEWSYIPVGATLPDTRQQHLGFGAAASMVHPATGYSVVRSLSEAPTYAAAIAAALQPKKSRGAYFQLRRDSTSAALEAWNVLWPNERKRQRAFFFFGLELLLQLDVKDMRTFFQTFFKLPERMWKGFLAADLSSLELISFALITFLVAPNSLRMQLVRHLVKDPSGATLIRLYTQLWP